MRRRRLYLATRSDRDGAPVLIWAVPIATTLAILNITGIWNESTGGGYWGPELRFAGYDGIAITGAQRNKLTQRQQRALEFTSHLAVFS